MMKPQMKKIGSLDCLVYGEENRPYTVVLFHGYGADASDLYPLYQIVDDPQVRWVFPNAPIEVPIEPHWMGRAWFEIDVMEMQRALNEGRYRDLAQQRPLGLDGALDCAEKTLEALNVPKQQLIVGGFSQGAMVATELATRLNENCLGVVLLSGTLLDQENWGQIMKARSGQCFFQSHGKSDLILSPDMAVALNELLYSSGWQGQLLTFNGGHEIPPFVLDRLALFLRIQMGIKVSNS